MRSSHEQHNIQVRSLPFPLVVSYRSPMFSMVGALNKLPIAASGMIFFGDPVTFGSVSAVAIGFFAGTVYAVAKNNQKKAESSRAQADAILPLTATTTRKP